MNAICLSTSPCSPHKNRTQTTYNCCQHILETDQLDIYDLCTMVVVTLAVCTSFKMVANAYNSKRVSCVTF